jgi:signal transduction histidine kinase
VLSITTSDRRRHLTRAASLGLLAMAVATVLVTAARPPRLASASYTAGSSGWFALALLTSAALMAAAVAAEPGSTVAPSMVLTGLLWTVPEWAGRMAAGGQTTFLAQTAAVVLPASALSAVVLVVRPREARWARTSSVLLVASGVLALGWDSFAEPGCWRACRPAIVPLSNGGHWLLLATLLAAVLSAVTLAGTVFARPDRRWTEVLAAIVGVALTLGLAAQILPGGSIVDASNGPPRRWAFATSQVAALALAGCASWWRVQTLATSWRLNRLARDIAQVGTPERMQAALARAMRDTSLTVSWWSSSRSGWVDCEGYEVPDSRTAHLGEPASGAPRQVTTVTSHGVLLAAVAHRSARSADHLAQSMRPAVVLSFDNAALQAATRGELAAARATAERLVERSEYERRILQRNLHDGAQQRLVGLAMAVGRVRSCAAVDAEASSRPELTGLLDDADALVREALFEVRRVAHGIHPPLLAELGLDAALQELADTSTRVVVRVTRQGDPALTPDPMSQARDATAYAAVEQFLGEARRRGASRLEVRIQSEGTRGLVLSLLDDGNVRSPDRDFVSDRVTALSGRLSIHLGQGALGPGALGHVPEGVR